MNPHDPDRDVYTPSRLNREARLQLEQAFRGLWIEGEISNLAMPSSGHAYFTLKDAGAQVRCALFRQNRLRSPVRLRDGLQVLMRGRVSVYEQRGDYQILADYVEESGEGQLRRQFEQLKTALAAEGLFDQSRKRPLPAYPRRIAIITSPTGAAIQDITSVLQRRFPCVEVIVIPSVVQGEEAPQKLLAALRLAERVVKPDVLLLTRGGGSIEDLWAFNDEALARAIAASDLVTVSAVGHEVDFCIADFAADVRAPTPSAASEMLVPDRIELHQTFDRLAMALDRAVDRRNEMLAATLAHLRQRLHAQRPMARLIQASQRLTTLSDRLKGVIVTSGGSRRNQVVMLSSRLGSCSPRAALGHLRDRLSLNRRQLLPLLNQGMTRRHEQVAAIARSLEGVSPLAVLQRGYSVTRRLDTGEVLRDATGLRAGDRLSTRLGSGQVKSTVDGALNDC